jgi:BolA protein
MEDETTAATIARRLRARLAPSHLQVVDESDLHAGHPGARAGGGHYRVTIVAAAFEGLARLERHRLVYEILNREMQGAIHALGLKTLTPREWGEPQEKPPGGDPAARG